MKNFSKSALLLALMVASVASYAAQLQTSKYSWRFKGTDVFTFAADNIADANKRVAYENTRYCKQGLYQGKPADNVYTSFCHDAPVSIGSKMYQAKFNWWQTMN